MENNERKIIEKIKKNYEPKSNQQTKLEELKSLDKKVKTPAHIFAYIFGTFGALVLGTGMCLAMKVIGDAMAVGIAIGVVGIVMVCITYPIFKKMLSARRAKYSNEIIAKSNELLND